MPKAFPGFIACKFPGRSDAEGKQGENDEEDEVRRVEKEMMNAVLTANLVDSSKSGVFFRGVVEEMGDAERGSSGAVAGEPFQHVNQCWDFMQVENELDERYDGLAPG